MLDKTGSLAVSFPVQIIYRSVSYVCCGAGFWWRRPRSCSVTAMTALFAGRRWSSLANCPVDIYSTSMIRSDLVVSLPYLTFGVGRLLHLPSAEAISVRPNAQPRYNQKVTVIGCEAKIGWGRRITSHLGLVTCSMVVPIMRSALS